jgi:hypothetical protein
MPDRRSAQLQEAAVTPGRTTSFQFDYPETVLTEPYLFQQRQGHQITPASTSNVHRLASGVWALTPINQFQLREQTASQALIMRLSEFSAAGVVVENPFQRALTEFLNIGNSGDVASSGDWVMSKRITAGATWQNTISTTAAPTLPSANYPLDCVAVCKTTDPPQMGYQFKFVCPGAPLACPDVVAAIRFGGPLYGSSYSTQDLGWFFCTFTGDGRALLFERVSGAWSQVAEWRYNAARDAPTNAQIHRITPHFGRYIEFLTGSAGMGFPGVGRITNEAILDLARQRQSPSNALGVYVHEVTNRGNQAFGNGPGSLYPITGPGQVAIYIRRDLLCSWQVSRIAYPASGTLTDKPFVLPYQVGSAHIVRLNVMGLDWWADDATKATSMSAVAQAADGSALTPATESFTYHGVTYSPSGWLPPGGANQMRAVITLTNSEGSSARWHSPAFTGYQIVRNRDVATVSPGTKTGGALRRLSITGPGYQPDHESAHLEIEDPTDALSALRTLGKSSIKVSTTTPGGGTACLFEGYTGRVTGTLKGKAGKVYPSPNWRHLSCELIGKFDRLAGRFFNQRFDFSNAQWSPSGSTSNLPEAWKVADILRFVLSTEGFADSQLDIPDDPLRLPTRGSSLVTPDLYSPPPGTEIGPYLTGLARDYLNRYLIWCGNAGTAGMWRLLSPPDTNTVPLWTFKTGLPVGAPKLGYRSEAYGASTSPIVTGSLGGPFRSRPVPAEANCVSVTGLNDKGDARITISLFNPNSWNSPTHSSATAVDNLDWLPGGVRPIEYVDAGLQGRSAILFVARRLFDLSARGRRLCEFHAPLALIDAHAAEPTIYSAGVRRPLRAGDLVYIDSDKWIIHSANPVYHSDLAQMCFYEAELFRLPNTLW